MSNLYNPTRSKTWRGSSIVDGPGCSMLGLSVKGLLPHSHLKLHRAVACIWGDRGLAAIHKPCAWTCLRNNTVIRQRPLRLSPISHARPNGDDWMVLCHNKQYRPTFLSSHHRNFYNPPGTLQITAPFLYPTNIPDRAS